MGSSENPAPHHETPAFGNPDLPPSSARPGSNAMSRRGRLLLTAAAAASDLGRSQTVIRLLAEAGSLGLGPHERAQAMLLEDGFRAGPAGDSARVRELVETASQVAVRGDRDLALNLLVAAASRCYFGDLRAEGRDVLIAADVIATESDDDRMLYIQAFAAPIERGANVLRDVGHTEMAADAATLLRQGMAVGLAGAYDRAAPLLAASAQRLREQGRLRLLGQVLAIQAWVALRVGDFAVARPAAEESRRLASEIEHPEWEIGAQTAPGGARGAAGRPGGGSGAHRRGRPGGAADGRAGRAQPGAGGPVHARTRLWSARRSLRAAAPHL